MDGSCSTPTGDDTASPKASPKARTISSDESTQPAKKRRTTLYEYNWRHVHEDLEKGNQAGVYGWDNAIWFGLAEKRANVDLNDFYSKRTTDEFYNPNFKNLLDNPATQEHWERIVTFDPMGMTAKIPTIAATTAHLNIPECSQLERDGVIVNEDGSINTTKAAVMYAWNIPALSNRLGFTEAELRHALHKYSNNVDVKAETGKNVFLPAVGGFTCYIFGKAEKIRDPKTEICVRVHDACNGSDVFGTDICTCRPYLMFAMQAAVECAQRGGVGIIVYFRKEGRSLGEVVKYRVYNARKNQEGGDTAKKYFYQTESIAGIRDARFQTMMPDVLNWLGVSRIDWLMSMSNEKYDAITEAGIQVMQRVALPDSFVPRNAFVEMHAKIASGYHTDSMEAEDVIQESRHLKQIRSQCQRIFDLGKTGDLKHFNLNLDKLPIAVNHTVETINKFYPELNIPYHSRFRHFGEGRVKNLMENWHCDDTEKVRRLLDLATVSVLVDAGAGPSWTYRAADGKTYNRSEGLAIASLDMFLDGVFSSDVAMPTRVNAVGLTRLTLHQIQRGFQVSASNNLTGLEGRTNLLIRLAKALEDKPEFFGREIHRPGHIVDYILRHVDDKRTVSVNVLWRAIIEGFESIWPEHISGVRRGDCWCHSSLKVVGKPGSDLIPFHKLSQWLAYSLIEPLEMLGIKFTDMGEMTGLAEYRNGGLFVDTEVVTLKDEAMYTQGVDVGSELVVEWRALTIILLDMVAEEVRKKYDKTADEMPLVKILEGGTWRAGRLLAGQKHGGKPPIALNLNGNVF